MRNFLYIILTFILFIAGYFFATGGTEARIALLKQFEISDPLFYSPGINSDSLHDAIEKVRVTENTVLDILAEHNTQYYSEPEKKLLRKEGFIPTDFLRSFAKVLKARQVFFDEPTIVSGIKLLTSQRFATHMYAKDTSTFLTLAMRTGHEKDLVKFRNFASITNDTVLKSDAELLVKNSVVLKSHVNMRIRCFLLMNCSTPPQKTLPTIPLPYTESVDDMLPKELLTFVNTDQEVHGPFQIESGCFEKETIPLYLTYYKDRIFLPKRADENFYLLLGDLDPRQFTPSQISLLESNIFYDEEPEGAPYRCSDLSYWGTLASYAYQSQNENLSPSDYTLLMENRLPYFDQMIYSLDYWLNVYRYSLYTDTPETLGSTLLNVRSAYSLTFGTFSKSIWRIDEKPTLLSSANLPISDTYTTYSELEKEYSKEKILRFHIEN